MQRGQPTTHALADDALGAAEVSCDLGVAALLEVVGLDRLALLGELRSRVARSLERSRSSRGSRSPRHRAGSAPSRALAAPHPEYDCCAAPRSTCGARSRTTRPAAALVPAESEAPRQARRRRSQRRDQTLPPGQAYPAAEEGKHRSEMPLVEDAERLSARARCEQKLGVRALLPVLHAFLYDDFTRVVTTDPRRTRSSNTRSIRLAGREMRPLGLLEALSATSPKPRYSAAS